MPTDRRRLLLYTGLTGTEEQPIDLNTLTEVGIYLLSGKILHYPASSIPSFPTVRWTAR